MSSEPNRSTLPSPQNIGNFVLIFVWTWNAVHRRWREQAELALKVAAILLSQDWLQGQLSRVVPLKLRAPRSV
jgi:hypothetical protein